MSSLTSVAWSSVGKKVIMAVTGLGLVIFVTVHLIGNMLLFNPDPDPFNKYSHFLISLGSFLYVIEAGLVAFFLFHIISGISVWLGKRKARPDAYKTSGYAGGPSRMNFPSLTMIYTGIVLLVFIILHVKGLKYGPYYTTMIDGTEVRDLHRLVMEVFSSTGYVVWYVAATSLIGFHLWHGFWSAFQSLGIYQPRLAPVINTVGYLLAILLAVGYIGIPIWIYFMRG